MGTKRTIDSGRKDKKGRPIKVSENSLAADENVNSKKNQLGDSAYSYESEEEDKEMEEFTRITNLLNDDLPGMNYKSNHSGSYDRDGVSSIASEISSGDGDGSGTIAIPELLGEDTIQRKANLSTMFPEWDGEETDYETDNGCTINDNYELEIPGNVLVEMIEEDDEIIDSLKYLETSPVLNNAVFEDFLDTGAREAMTENDWSFQADCFADYQQDKIYENYKESIDYDYQVEQKVGSMDNYDSEEEYDEAINNATIELEENYHDAAQEEARELRDKIENSYEDFIEHVRGNYNEFLDWHGEITVLDSQFQQFVEDRFY